MFQAVNCACEMNCPLSSQTIAFEALQDPAHHCEGFPPIHLSPSFFTFKMQNKQGCPQKHLLNTRLTVFCVTLLAYFIHLYFEVIQDIFCKILQLVCSMYTPPPKRFIYIFTVILILYHHIYISFFMTFLYEFVIVIVIVVIEFVCIYIYYYFFYIFFPLE